MPRRFNPAACWALSALGVWAFSCQNEVHLGQPDIPANKLGDDDPASGPGTGGAVPVGAGGAGGIGAGGAGPGGATAGTCVLVPSGPVTITEAGTVVENLAITASGVPGLTIRAADVFVRNVSIQHEGGAGLLIESADNVHIEGVTIEHTGAPASGPHESPFEDNLRCANSAGLTITTARFIRGASGAYLRECPDATLRFIEGHDFRGPSFRGQFVRFETSDRGRLEDFSVINPLGSWSENNVEGRGSTDVYVARGHIDGNNAPTGHGVIFSADAQGMVEDVDAIRMGNGCFSAYTGADGSTFRRTRCRENICEDQGRGLPESGAVMWSGDNTHSNLIVQDSVYFDPCLSPNVVWPLVAFSTLELREEDFEMRPPLSLDFCWE